MLYEEARVYLDQVSKYGSVLGLESIKGLLEELENPQNDLTFIHIAGTNGKGSILAYISGILTEAGYRTGRYISPTVMEYLERFQVDGKYMAEDELGAIIEKVKNAARRSIEKGNPSPTVFEIETAAAFLYFKEKACDVVVLEAGFGGLLDATNIIKNTKICVFASISMDHMGILGDTLKEITKNKAGIIKTGADVISAPQREEVFIILKAKAGEKECRFFNAEPEKIIIHEETLEGQSFSYKQYKNVEISLSGRHQLENAVTAIEAIERLQRRGYKIGDRAIRKGLKNASWPGRFMLVNKEPVIIADGAHNVDAVKRLTESIRTYFPDKKIIGILGVFKDKEYEKMIEIIAPYFKYIYAIELPNKERSLAKEKLSEILKAYHVNSETTGSVQEALEKAKERAGDKEVILTFGSLSYLGEVIRLTRGKEGKDGR